jgi:hypothetical protein
MMPVNKTAYKNYKKQRVKELVEMFQISRSCNEANKLDKSESPLLAIYVPCFTSSCF